MPDRRGSAGPVDPPSDRSSSQFMPQDSIPSPLDNGTAEDTARIRRELERLQAGEHEAMDALLPLLFQPLRRIARAQRQRIAGGETLRTTALIHEAYLKLRGSQQLRINDEHHFLNLAARAMRQILIDHARSRVAAQQREEQVGHADQFRQVQRHAHALLDLDEALDRLEPEHPRLAQIVICRFFAGYTEQEVADLLKLSPRTVRREWLKAKAWLLDELGGQNDATITP